jgi:hypothetical protein
VVMLFESDLTREQIAGALSIGGKMRRGRIVLTNRQFNLIASALGRETVPDKPLVLAGLDAEIMRATGARPCDGCG